MAQLDPGFFELTDRPAMVEALDRYLTESGVPQNVRATIFLAAGAITAVESKSFRAMGVRDAASWLAENRYPYEARMLRLHLLQEHT